MERRISWNILLMKKFANNFTTNRLSTSMTFIWPVLPTMDGLDVIDELTLGQRVTMVKEINNPYDEKAVAIYL